MQYTKEKADILLLPILFYNKAKISKTINIFIKLIQRLDLDNYIFEDKVVMAKGDSLTI